MSEKVDTDIQRAKNLILNRVYMVQARAKQAEKGRRQMRNRLLANLRRALIAVNALWSARIDASTSSSVTEMAATDCSSIGLVPPLVTHAEVVGVPQWKDKPGGKASGVK